MSEPKVTVIVPVYNVASYIKKCAISLFEQTLDSLEILFVDDCSPDNSVEIIKETLNEYPERNLLMRIIRMPYNGGLASARRQGIIEATGQYIIHCDGDDWVDTDLYERLYNKAIETNADLVMCDLVHERKNGQTFYNAKTISSMGKDIIREWYNNIVPMYTVNKLVKRSLITEHNILPWAGLNMWEDNGLCTRLLYYAGHVEFVHESYYHYNRMNENAITYSYGIKSIEQMIGVAKHLTEFFKSIPDAKEFEKTAMAFQYLARINLITDSFNNLLRYNRTFKGSEAIIPELDPNAFSTKGRFRFRMVQYRLGWLFVLMFKMKNLLQKGFR